MCAKCLSYSVMQFYTVLLGDFVNSPDLMLQSICVPHPALFSNRMMSFTAGNR